MHTFRSIACKTEQEVFEALGLQYVPPDERNAYENWEHDGKTAKVAIEDEDEDGWPHASLEESE